MSPATSASEAQSGAPLGALTLASHRQAFAALAPQLGRRRLRILAAVLVSLAASACAMVPALAVGALVDGLTARPSMQVVAWAVAVMVAGIVAGALLAGWSRVLFAKIAEPAVGGLREDVVERALDLETGQAGDDGGGDLVSRISDDSRIVASAVGELLPSVAGAATLLVLSIPTLFTLHWALGLVALLGVPLYWLSLRWYLPRSQPLYELERERLGRRTGRLLGAVNGEAALRAQGWSEAERRRIAEASAASRDAGIAVFRMLTAFFARNNRAEFVVMAALLVVGYVLVVSDAASVGAVTAAALLFHRLFDPISTLVVLFDVVQEAGVALRRLTGVLTLPTRAERGGVVRDGDGADSGAAGLHPPRGLHADVASHAYPGAAPVLDGVRLDIAPGETVALVGTTGAGKSTLAAILAGTLTASEGTASVGGVPLGRLDAAELRERVVKVSQRTHVFAGTLRANLQLGVPEASRNDQDCLRALEGAGASWVNAWQQGLDETVGHGGRTLTTVQEQQLALARVALIDPEFVVLDEATAEAGSAGARSLDEAARAAMRGRGALIVAHRLSQASIADRIVVLEHGRIVEEGAHHELLVAGGRYAKLWEAWSVT